ncbi:MAG: hypothetical protein Q7T05_06990, partial [Dehalococcoidia bacterium]|nr:hypothetical protein [Dehalococcoidia bacterium]
MARKISDAGMPVMAIVAPRNSSRVMFPCFSNGVLTRGVLGMLAVALWALCLPSSAKAVPISTSKDPKVLNNLVVELINVRGTVGDYRFSNPRDGWVFVSFAGTARKGSRAFVAIDSTNRDDAIIMCEPGGAKTAETMRYLPAGEHRLVVRWEGRPSRSHIIVRSVPEILYAELGYESDNVRNRTTKSI